MSEEQPWQQPNPLLHAFVTLVYGRVWQMPLAEDLGVNLRTVQRWASGKQAPPPGIYAKLAALARARVAELEELLPALMDAAEPLDEDDPDYVEEGGDDEPA
jgi:transcriptional regulator with XRE-family HTH domain